ncbi:hypothetical protein CPB86DRAFT_64242 [Serendipita vermifera]|nr:hypothetical protein CPB86DRAFT_64242 [Serendipita vermifera]
MQKGDSGLNIGPLNTPPTKDLHGRQFSNLNDTYMLPSMIDQDESIRLDKQGVALKIAMGGLYFCPNVVERLLYPIEGNQQRVLDVGCGTGMWATDMACRFPHVSVLGIDLTPPTHDPGKHPPNLQFQTYDANRGMSPFHGQFDFIQMRCMGSGLYDTTKTIEELMLSLKPGGFLTLMDGDPVNFRSGEGKAIPMAKVSGEDAKPSVSEDGSWLIRMCHESHTASKIAGSDMIYHHKLIDLGLWNHPLCDPNTAGAASIYLPLGPWDTGMCCIELIDDTSMSRIDPDPVNTRKLQIVGTLMQQAFLTIHLAFHPIILKYGVERNTVEEWSLKTDYELRNFTHKMRVRYRCCWARRRSLDGPLAPSLPNHPGFSPLPSAISSLPLLKDNQEPRDQGKDIESAYPGIEVYTSQEQATAELEKRNEAIGILPKAEVERAWERKQSVAC